MTACRQSATQPLVLQQSPPPPTKKTKDISVTKKKAVGEGGSCDGAFVSKCGIFAIDAPSVDDK